MQVWQEQISAHAVEDERYVLILSFPIRRGECPQGRTVSLTAGVAQNFAFPQTLLGNVVLQAGACFVDPQAEFWGRAGDVINQGKISC